MMASCVVTSEYLFEGETSNREPARHYDARIVLDGLILYRCLGNGLHVEDKKFGILAFCYELWPGRDFGTLR